MGFSLAADLWPMLAALLAGVSCAILGNFLVLRKVSMMGDAISHSVLPGLVIAFLITASRDPFAMLLGAAIAGVTTVILVEIVKRLGRVESGAAMGVVFSLLFALGVLLIEREELRQIDLDADCVLYGQLETIGISTPHSNGVPTGIPSEVTLLLIVCILAILAVVVLFKELRIATFDPAMATMQGIPAGALQAGLMVAVALATVASFEAVGSILVIAMLICPAATARLLTDRLGVQLLLSVLIATLSVGVGYTSAAVLPMSLGTGESYNAAGGIAVASGVIFTLTIIASPSQGLIARLIRRRGLANRVALDDLIAALYRIEEDATPPSATGASHAQLAIILGSKRLARALADAKAQGYIKDSQDHTTLTPQGRSLGMSIVRRHRLWESYLVDRAGYSPDHVHDTAERLEHLAIEPSTKTTTDPHGKAIPHADAHSPS